MSKFIGIDLLGTEVYIGDCIITNSYYNSNGIGAYKIVGETKCFLKLKPLKNTNGWNHTKNKMDKGGIYTKIDPAIVKHRNMD